MPNAPYLDASVRWKLKSGAIAFRELRTAEVAAQLLDNGLVTEVLGTIGAGKEADVFLARDGHRVVVAKSYRLYRTSNRSRGAVKADGMGHLASREFELLGYAWAHRVPVPEPFAREENAFTMEFVGDADGPAPQLRRTRLEAPEEFARELLAAIDDLAHAGVVHTDLSPFNILVHRGHPVIIDLGKGLRVDRLGASPWIRLNEARTALEHALETLRRYFGRYGVPFETEGLLAQILRDIDRFGVGAYPD
ncbi:MAG: RIO1 family regulatory kinase/ATPase [Thermoplasmata archaeon]